MPTTPKVETAAETTKEPPMAKRTELLLAKKAMVEAILEAHEGRKATAAPQKPEAQAGMFDQMMQNWEALTAMTVENGVAVIPLRGTITPDDPFAALYGETSLAAFTANFMAAMADASVKSIVINAYSPGGYVYGVEAAANMVYAARGTKPITAYTDSLAASAAYWLISAADKIVLGSETAEVGSIGVYMAHFDYSGMLDQMGIKVTEITSGEFKGIGSPYSGLTADEQKVLQADVNYVYTRFVNTVARNRGMSVADVLKSANGLTFYGSDAVTLGLADSINTIQEVLDMTTPATAATEQTEAQKAEAAKKAEADAKLAAENERLTKELADYRAKDAASAKDKLKAEANVAYKAAFGREATVEEQDGYAALDETGRKLVQSNLKESGQNREKLVAAQKLTGEIATEGTVETNKEGNLIVLAARRLGFAAAAK
jgi:signal peptide peptidase SppA